MYLTPFTLFDFLQPPFHSGNHHTVLSASVSLFVLLDWLLLPDLHPTCEWNHMVLESVMLSEISHVEKDKNHMCMNLNLPIESKSL